MNYKRVFSIIRKEFFQIKRDKRTIAIIILMPIMELLLFGYAASTSVDHIPTVVYNNDIGSESRELLNSFVNSQYFDLDYNAISIQDVEDYIDNGYAKAGIVIPPEYSEDIKNGNIDAAIQACDEQKGSVANAIKAALIKYQEVRREGLDSEKAAETIQKEIEEATSLEMPMLEKNMTIIATLVSIGTLVGLLGTVSGMIKAFSGLATAGAPDQAALANGISEALINTATGIATSTIATIAYNYFTSKIDTLTYFIDEAGATITQTYRRAKGNK